MTAAELAARLIAVAHEINTMNSYGALHIFVADGNVDDDALRFCLREPSITGEERDFVARMLNKYSEDERAAAWLFASTCTDI